MFRAAAREMGRAAAQLTAWPFGPRCRAFAGGKTPRRIIGPAQASNSHESLPLAAMPAPWQAETLLYMKKTHTPGASRRDFLKRSALAAAAFQVVPGHVLGLNGATPPSGKLNIAGVGVGGQGSSDLNEMRHENIVALCDADFGHAAHCFKRYPQARQWKDYRKMLEEQKDIEEAKKALKEAARKGTISLARLKKELAL